MQLAPRSLVASLPGLSGQEELIAVLGHPLTDMQFSVTVARSNIDVVNPVLKQHLESPLLQLRICLPEGSSAEDDTAALVTGAAEVLSRDHQSRSAMATLI